jgi:hypothetical protein
MMSCCLWQRRLLRWLLATVTLVLAKHTVTSAWALPMVLWWGWESWWLFVDTLDLLFGRWLRRGPRAVSVPPVRVRRIIIEEVVVGDHVHAGIAPSGVVHAYAVPPSVRGDHMRHGFQVSGGGDAASQ